MVDGGMPAMRAMEPGSGVLGVARKAAGTPAGTPDRKPRRTVAPLYTAEEQRRRDETVWTLVQGLLAPFQFVVFLVSLVLVLRCLTTGTGAWAADVSVIAKTITLYTIMVTGSIWEKVVFGKWLFAPAFFWEDAVSMVVIALHTAYVIMLVGKIGTTDARLIVALAAYITYVVNAAQFLLKLRAARLQAKAESEAKALHLNAGAEAGR
jgi:3-vinyl bacteriochlorophyllide hydratase